MSGLEVLGAMASIAQLVAYTITVSSKLNEIRSKIRDAPKILEQYDRQFKELIVVAKHIEQNPPLQTEELNIYLTAMVAKTGAIKDILANFEQSSKSRQRWSIASGNLSRQLDESFGDVKNTMGNLVFLIISQNAQDQKELRELILRSTETAAASSQARTATTSLVSPNEDSFASAESVNRKAGSHSFKGLKIRDSGTVSMGNVSTPNSTQSPMAGHLFTDFTASGNKVLHIGNIGGNSEGHFFNVGVVEKNEVTMLGDYTDLDQMFRNILLQRDFMVRS